MKVYEKTYVENGTTYRIMAKAILRKIGAQAPYFSLTGEIDRKARNNRWMEDSGGCIHDEIVKHFPALAPLVAMHLSDIDGAPMHAVGNGIYNAVGGCFVFGKWSAYDGNTYKVPATEDEIINRIQNHFRVGRDEALKIRADFRTCGISPSAYDNGNARMAALVATMRERWKADAKDAIEKFNLQIVI